MGSVADAAAGIDEPLARRDEGKAGPRPMPLKKGVIGPEAAQRVKMQRLVPGWPDAPGAHAGPTGGAGDGQNRMRPDREVQSRRRIDLETGRPRRTTGQEGAGVEPSDVQPRPPTRAAPEG